MKIRATLLVAILAAAAGVVLAQSSETATLRTASGDRPVTFVTQGGIPFFSADEFFTALGGTVSQDATGSRVSLRNLTGAFGTDSRFGVVGDELIEMPAAPLRIEGKPFVPLAYLQGFLRAAGEELTFDAGTKTFTLARAASKSAAAQVSLVEVEDTSKLVIQLSAAIEHTVIREAAGYRIRFRGDVQGPYTEQSFENPHVAKIHFGTNEIFVTLRGNDIAGDAYQLENPFRVVIDLRKGVAPLGPGATAPGGFLRPTDPPGIRTIVLDPGHGGKEVGAVGAGGLMEKDVTLAICRRLASLLGSRLGARVVLTRSDDSVVTLDQRTALANQYKADLFLSVHLNASVQRVARGSETYFLSLEASDDLSRAAADRENASAASSSSNASSDLKLILWDLAQQEYLTESSRLAEIVQDEMNQATGVVGRGVKQAPFKVLVGATMPAALVEVGFISNPDEEAKLKDETFQTQVAETLLRAVERYKKEYETKLGINVQTPASRPETTAPAAVSTAAPAATTTAKRQER